MSNAIEPTPEDHAKRSVIEVFNADGELVSRSYGKTVAELLEDHIKGRCGAWCDYCYHEAMLTKGLPIDI